MIGKLPASSHVSLRHVEGWGTRWMMSDTAVCSMHTRTGSELACLCCACWMTDLWARALQGCEQVDPSRGFLLFQRQGEHGASWETDFSCESTQLWWAHVWWGAVWMYVVASYKTKCWDALVRGRKSWLNSLENNLNTSCHTEFRDADLWL